MSQIEFMDDERLAESRPTVVESPRHGPASHGARDPQRSISNAGATADRDLLLVQILEELRAIRRERQHDDFSLGRLAGAVVQAFAICAIAWGLYAAANLETAAATIRILSGIAFQLVALTMFTAGRRN